MKQKVLVLTGFLLIAAATSAQPEAGTLSLTPHAGLNVSTFLGHADVRVNYLFDDGAGCAVTSKAIPKLGFSAGCELEYQLREKWAVSVGVAGNGLGSRFKGFSLEGHTLSDAYIGLSYINVPLMAKYYAGDRVALGVGLQPGILLCRHAGADFSRGGGYTVSSTADDFGHFDMSVPLSVSFSTPASVFYELRCNLGISNLIQGRWEPSAPTCFNESLCLSVGYRIKL